MASYLNADQQPDLLTALSERLEPSAPTSTGEKPFPWIFVSIYLSLLRLAVTVKQGRK